MFYSIQGEGPTAGRPSVFLRLSGCTLSCAWCDTTPVWSRPGTHFTAEALVAEFERLGFLDYLSTHNARLIVTGGSPLKQYRYWAPFLKAVLFQCACPVEIETEGVLLPDPELARVQFNVSPKLENSQMPEKARIREDVLAFHADDEESYFKFVVNDGNDMMEILDLCQKFGIDKSKVYLMPMASTRQEHLEKGILVADLAKNYGMNFSPRLQVLLWDRVTGV